MSIPDCSAIIKLLYARDQEILLVARKKGCHCAGKLDTANYSRKVRGIPTDVEDLMDTRFSLCCRDCRKRTTPISMRFWGRKIYWVMTIITNLILLSSNDRSVPPQTLKRWQRYFSFMPLSRFWREHSSRFMPPLNTDHLLTNIVNRFFSRDGPNDWYQFLLFIMPLSQETGSL